jgi:hypothetical protein
MMIQREAEVRLGLGSDLEKQLTGGGGALSWFFQV